jgi:hypothetical protein
MRVPLILAQAGDPVFPDLASRYLVPAFAWTNGDKLVQYPGAFSS